MEVLFLYLMAKREKKIGKNCKVEFPPPKKLRDIEVEMQKKVE